MATAALSPNSVLASPIQVNPQVKNDLQGSVPQVSQDAQKAVKAVQTDTITISTQALKMAADNRPASDVKEQLKVDPQKSSFQDAKEIKDARIAAKTSQFDTISISPKALQLAADKDVAAKEVTDRDEEQSAVRSLNSKVAFEKNETRRDLPVVDDKTSADKAAAEKTAARKADEKQTLQAAHEKAEAEKKSAGKSALKAADDRAEAAKVAADKAEERRAVQLANDKNNAEKKATRKRAVKAYAAVSSNK